MKTDILFIRSVPLERDSRSVKMVSEYRQRGMRVMSLIWSRGEPPSNAPDTATCKVRSGYGRGLGGISARLAFMLFIAFNMIRDRRKFNVVHVVDLDTGIIGVPIARLLGKPIIYDAFDHIGAIAGHGWLGRLLAHVERFLISQASIVIFPDPIRLEQYGVVYTEKICIIGNIPDIATLPRLAKARREAPLQLVYIGTLEAKHRGLEYLPEVCSALGTRIEVVVGGMGELHSFFEEASARLTNLTYIGQRDYEAALIQMAKADCLYGPYLLTAPAHFYASPNKMYEHLALGKPLITNTGTPPAKLVQNVRSGFLFDGSMVDLLRLLAEVNRQECTRVGRQARAAWIREFCGLREQQLESFFAQMDVIISSKSRIASQKRTDVTNGKDNNFVPKGPLDRS